MRVKKLKPTKQRKSQQTLRPHSIVPKAVLSLGLASVTPVLSAGCSPAPRVGTDAFVAADNGPRIGTDAFIPTDIGPRVGMDAFGPPTMLDDVPSDQEADAGAHLDDASLDSNDDQ